MSRPLYAILSSVVPWHMRCQFSYGTISVPFRVPLQPAAAAASDSFPVPENLNAMNMVLRTLTLCTFSGCIAKLGSAVARDARPVAFLSESASRDRNRKYLNRHRLRHRLHDFSKFSWPRPASASASAAPNAETAFDTLAGVFIPDDYWRIIQDPDPTSTANWLKRVIVTLAVYELLKIQNLFHSCHWLPWFGFSVTPPVYYKDQNSGWSLLIMLFDKFSSITYPSWAHPLIFSSLSSSQRNSYHKEKMLNRHFAVKNENDK